MAFRSVASRLLFWVAGTTGIVFALALVYSFLVSRVFVLEDASRIALRTAESHGHVKALAMSPAAVPLS